MAVKFLLKETENTFEFDLDKSLREVREEILRTLNIGLDEADLSNETPKVYRNFGRMVMNTGRLPRSYDSRLLKEFLVDGQDILVATVEVDEEYIKMMKELENRPPVKRVVRKEAIPVKPRQEQGFVYSEDDFPPLV